MSFAQTLAEDRRLVILRTLAEAPGCKLNEQVLRTALDGFGHRAPRDVLRADIAWLAEHRLVEQTTMHVASGELWLVELLQDGRDVADGRIHPGVARPGLR